MKLIAAFLIVVFAACACASCSSYQPGVASPPCPRNYLFSCQPQLVPVPCSASAASCGSAGAYTEQVPSYVYYGDKLHGSGYMYQA
nr:vitelline membrane protein Vm32E [Drosophila virilis]